MQVGFVFLLNATILSVTHAGILLMESDATVLPSPLSNGHIEWNMVRTTAYEVFNNGNDS